MAAANPLATALQEVRKNLQEINRCDAELAKKKKNAQISKPPVMSVPNDGRTKANKGKPLELRATFMPMCTELGVFRKWLQSNSLPSAMDRDAPAVLIEGKVKQFQTGMYVYPDESLWPENMTKADIVAQYHLHIIFTRPDEEGGKWRLTAVLPKEEDRTAQKEQNKNRLTGTPEDWVNASSKYNEPLIQQLVRDFALAVTSFKKELKELKSEDERDEKQTKKSTTADVREKNLSSKFNLASEDVGDDVINLDS